MKVIQISDMTIKEAARSNDVAFSFKEQMAIARALDSLGVDVIELPAANTKSGSLLVKSLSPVINNATICVEAGLSEEEVEQALVRGDIVSSLMATPLWQYLYSKHKSSEASLNLAKCSKLSYSFFPSLNDTELIIK